MEYIIQIVQLCRSVYPTLVHRLGNGLVGDNDRLAVATDLLIYIA